MTETPRSQRDYTCREVVELVSDYLEGALTPQELTAVEVHLNFCDGCFTFLNQVRTTAATARVLREEQIPDEIKDKLLEAFNDWKRE